MAFSGPLVFLDCTGTVYNGKTAKEKPLGGIERCLIRLSEELADSGFDVTVINNTDEKINHNGVAWRKQPDRTSSKPLWVIACNDPTLFDRYSKQTGHKDFIPIIWIHNRQRLEKIIRKKRLGAYLRWKPTGIFLSNSHIGSTSRLIPLARRTVIGHGVEREILDHPPSDLIPPPSACFISQPYRGLAQMVEIWIKNIHPSLPQSTFHIYANPTSRELNGTPREQMHRYGIIIEGRKPRAELTESLNTKRLMLIPGHKDETYCLAAAESVCLGLPVITRGIGALKERIRNGETGYIALDMKDFAEKAKILLTDDDLWRKFHESCLNERTNHSWSKTAAEWSALLQSLPVGK